MIAPKLALALLAFSLGASAKTNRKPDQVNAQSVLVRTIYGDRTTQLTLVKTASGARLYYASNSGEKSSRALSAPDYDFFHARILKTPGTRNDVKLCARNFIQVWIDGHELIACLGSANEFAREMRKTVDLLLIMAR